MKNIVGLGGTLAIHNSDFHCGQNTMEKFAFVGCNLNVNITSYVSPLVIKMALNSFVSA